MICLKNRTFAVSQTTRPRNAFDVSQLWFAWKIVLLQYRKQQGYGHDNLYPRCDLLEKSYFCSIANNYLRISYPIRLVVICLKNRTFAVSQTTLKLELIEVERLWFAWKIVLLQYRKQLNTPRIRFDSVVICLKNRTFAVSQTTMRQNLYAVQALWFAWKIVLLQYRKQPFRFVLFLTSGCDLLEKSYFCSIANNELRPTGLLSPVVICLKNRTFAVSQTTQRV